MARVLPIKFKRVAAAFNEAARLCESSGSEHSPSSDSFANLSDLVTSFMEREGRVKDEEDDDDEKLGKEECEGNDFDDCLSDSDESSTREALQEILARDDNGNEEKAKIGAEVELACEFIGRDRVNMSSHDFKRRLTARLCDRGFDAGLCKSRWEKTGRLPAGDYQYIDVNVHDTRYIAEVSLAGEFEIARPTDRITSLLKLFPPIFIGQPEELKQVVRIMSTAIRQSLKKKGLLVPPWRKNSYMQNKWFSSYKRTTNRVSEAGSMAKSQDSQIMKHLIGFEASRVKDCFCREDFMRKTRSRMTGNLTMAFEGPDTSLHL
ncbi:hypothetical protein BT93_L2491 [Corymbia citriodora subsp. variegata]|uniref:Uncharacterized protein n=1 Tax=Corymbia citriodora subsp. variegata TaxID=360336 RepID=A0A8T0CPT3_CORYI|nr:hypothetical protein BT93_L2491 [Corymbia citriodora subsp. variegata]